jgi:hypothetical protein
MIVKYTMWYMVNTESHQIIADVYGRTCADRYTGVKELLVHAYPVRFWHELDEQHQERLVAAALKRYGGE